MISMNNKIDANNDIALSSDGNAAKASSIYSIPLDAWSVCLEFLSPSYMTIASSCLSKEMSSGYAGERAAWVALKDIMSKAYGIRIVQLDLYPQETWLGLYRICWSLLKDVRKEQIVNVVSHNDNDDYDSSVKDLSITNDEYNIFHDNELTRGLFWLIFGYDKSLSSSAFTTSCIDVLASAWCHKVSQESSEWKSNHRSRVQSTSLRLRDVGKWSEASSVLTSLVAGTKSYQMDDGKHLFQKDTAEINICISTFLIDRLYAGTYVQRSATDSMQLSDAVTCGRSAVFLCLQSQNDDGSVRIWNSNTPTSSPSFLAPNLPPPVSLYPSNLLRLAASRLALGRSLALLAQHIGLKCTGEKDVTVRPSSDNIRFSAKAFFQEGEHCLKTSIAVLTSEQETDDSFSLLEMLAGTYSALGELYYCLSSVAKSSAALRDSIKYMTSSLRLVHSKLITDHGIASNIQALCAASPRSLMMLQAQTAKDLGKVYHFSQRFPRFNNSSFQPKILYFALVVSMQYHNHDHPSLENIKRLAHHGIQGTKADLEEEVNQMLINNFLPE